MQLFLKAAEIWQPDARGVSLRLSSSYYGDLVEFADVSQDMTFDFGEGLPGAAWAARRPLVWTDLGIGAFKRTEAAAQAGIACGIAIPILVGDFLLAVAVLFCGKAEAVIGAVEVWENPPGSDTELRLTDGYYGDLERFEWVSRRLSIMRGRGLPGGAWELGGPLILNDLGSSNTFLRARNAAEAGITTGLAMPYLDTEDGVQVLTLLSAKGTPIARRFEIWTPDGESEALRFAAGHCEAGTDLTAKYAGVAVSKGEGPLGEVWLSGKPQVTAGGAAASGEPTIVLPVIARARLAAVVALVL